jgi:hypothetical protein
MTDIEKREQTYRQVAELQTPWMREELLAAMLEEEPDPRLQRVIEAYLLHGNEYLQ